MKAILISSSVLIAVLLLLRAIFAHSIPRRVQYALWGLVLLRLLIPVSLPSSALSVLNLGQAAQTQVEETVSKDIYVLPVSRSPISDYPTAYGLEPGDPVPTAESFGHPVLNRNGVTVTKYAGQLPLSTILRWIWYTGMAAMSLWFLISNLRFLHKIKRERVPHPVPCKYPVYLCGGLSSPCLFGLFRPAVYLTSAVVSNEVSLHHVLAHEETHARHLDTLWSLLRCVCLTVYWFDPLVWAAAILSKTDCELACDESVLRRLGAEERIPYGRTLLSLVRTRPGNPLLSATTMTAGKRQLKDRITRIAENRRTVSTALFVALSAMILLAACTFTGTKSTVVLPGGAEPVNALTLPDSEPDAVVSLEDVVAHEPEAVTVSEADHAAAAQAVTSNAKPLLQSIIRSGKYTVLCRQDSDGVTYFTYGVTAEIKENLGTAQFYDFLTCPALHYEHDYSVQPFTDLLDHNGFVITYCAGKDREPLVPSQPAQSEYTAHRYYYFDTDGTLRLLASTIGSTDTIADWDGDGVTELISPPWDAADLPSFYFVRDGGICAVDLAAMAERAYPGWEPYIGFGSYDETARDLPVSGYNQKDGYIVDALRYLFFTGTELRFYKDWRVTADHVVGTPDVPDDVLAAAKDAVLNAFNGTKSDTLLLQAGYDDWRVERLTHAQDYTFNDTTIEVYNLNYEFHAAHPEKVVLAGGAYLTEDGWHMPDNPYCLFFSVRGGKRVFLKGEMINDGSPGTELFDSEVRSIALDAGIVSMTDLTKEELLIDFYATSFDFTERLGSLSAADKAAVCEKLCYYRTCGTDEEQSLYQDTIQAMNYNANDDSMSAAWKAGYSFLGYYNCPTPTATEEQREAAALAAGEWMEQMKRNFTEDSACLSFQLLYVGIDDAETARMVNRDTDAALAQSRGWSHEYVTQMVAVLAVYDVEWESGAGPSDENGRSAQHLYLLPDKSGGNIWQVEDTMGCAVPMEYRTGDGAPQAAPEGDSPGVAAWREAKAAAQVQNQVLSVSPSTRTYDELIEWLDNPPTEPGPIFVPQSYQEGDGCVIYLGQWIGVPHNDQYDLYCYFADGTEAQLPLPFASAMAIAEPQSMDITDNTLTYEITFDDNLYVNSYLHFVGTYVYTVDLTAKTVSLNIS